MDFDIWSKLRRLWSWREQVETTGSTKDVAQDGLISATSNSLLGAVRHDTAQALSDAAKVQALQNQGYPCTIPPPEMLRHMWDAMRRVYPFGAPCVGLVGSETAMRPISQIATGGLSADGITPGTWGSYVGVLTNRSINYYQGGMDVASASEPSGMVLSITHEKSAGIGWSELELGFGGTTLTVYIRSGYTPDGTQHDYSMEGIGISLNKRDILAYFYGGYYGDADGRNLLEFGFKYSGSSTHITSVYYRVRPTDTWTLLTTVNFTINGSSITYATMRMRTYMTTTGALVYLNHSNIFPCNRSYTTKNSNLPYR